ncbi:MAG: sodium:solute symporter [Clostridium sp.]|nr:sodium:solute symporter [Clostridium sp.]
MSTVVAYWSLLLLISFFKGKTKAGNDDFFRGNRKSPWYLVAFGMIGASLSGVTFVSVPGTVRTADFTYLQTCMGFILGYWVVAYVLLPLYYKLNLTSIYTYLGQRFGKISYRTGASFFLLSKLLGASVRLYMVCVILQQYVFDLFHIPFECSVCVLVFLIWFYTRRTGIRTLVWTDALQTLVLLLTLFFLIWQVISQLDFSVNEALEAVWNHPHCRIFVWDDWHSRNHFVKQFFSGIFIVIVMTGLDQDTMQKNLTCKSLKEAQRNMLCYGVSFLPVNFFFLSLGVLFLLLASSLHMELPASGDEILPFFCTSGVMGISVMLMFCVGVIAAAFSSADSAMTALTTSCCVDLFGRADDVRLRKRIHLLMGLLFIVCILLFRRFNNTSLIDAVYVVASYTYGPLLGMFAFGLYTRRMPCERYVPWIALFSPVVCYALSYCMNRFAGYTFGYELLMLNGLLTFVGLWLSAINRNNHEIDKGRTREYH